VPAAFNVSAPIQPARDLPALSDLPHRTAALVAEVANLTLTLALTLALTLTRTPSPTLTLTLPLTPTKVAKKYDETPSGLPDCTWKPAQAC